MSRVKSIIKSLLMTKWFIKTSWGYITTKHFNSKVEFFAGLLPAWFKFTVATYKDFRKA
tara:strand:+ start:674 stop:850 length:177 start_codon:yes stop_codon:yes gene_type:complete